MVSSQNLEKIYENVLKFLNLNDHKVLRGTFLTAKPPFGLLGGLVAIIGQTNHVHAFSIAGMRLFFEMCFFVGKVTPRHHLRLAKL